MKKLSNFLSKNNLGFTMIELLVVIAVIGVLAVAVLASINPIEQINKGRDTRKRSNAAQLINAIDRFYAINEKYPWNDMTYATDLSGDTQPTVAFPDDAACANNGSDFCVIGGTGYVQATAGEWLDGLSTTEEVKDSFIDQLSDSSATNVLYINKAAGTAADIYICFEPASKQFQQEAADGCESRSAILPANACSTTDGTIPTAPAVNLICLP